MCNKIKPQGQTLKVLIPCLQNWCWLSFIPHLLWIVSLPPSRLGGGFPDNYPLPKKKTQIAEQKYDKKVLQDTGHGLMKRSGSRGDKRKQVKPSDLVNHSYRPWNRTQFLSERVGLCLRGDEFALRKHPRTLGKKPSKGWQLLFHILCELSNLTALCVL